MDATERQYQTVHPRLPVDLHRRIGEYAERTHRNLSNAIVHLLEVGLRTEESE